MTGVDALGITAVMGEMRMHQETLEVATGGRGFTDITARVREVVRRAGVETGLCVVFIRHTSASLVIQENADGSVRRDLQAWLDGLAPESRGWEHVEEGPDDMPAHAKAAVLRTSETIPVTAGVPVLGTWQGLYVVEHRAARHARQVVVHVQGLGAGTDGAGRG